ncbi:MAG TPA: PIN domain-containing protein [Planctomycetota bacterium]|nr:PIN domain-containing protein [Planctomycetota bacterium]
MAFVVLYDACVLYPAPLRDLLIRIAEAGVVRATWSEEILEECFRNILKDRKDLSPAKLARTRELMRIVLPDCLVTGYEALIPALKLPDPGDRHVLAAAVKAGAQVLVTANLKHFPEKTLKPFNIEAMHPDDFVLDAIDLAQGVVTEVVRQQAASLKNPPRTVGELLETLKAQGLVQTVAKLRDLGV